MTLPSWSSPNCGALAPGASGADNGHSGSRGGDEADSNNNVYVTAAEHTAVVFVHTGGLFWLHALPLCNLLRK